MKIQVLQKRIIEELQRLSSEDFNGEGGLYSRGLESKEYWEDDGESAYEWGFNLGEQEGEIKAYKEILNLIK